jgi:hypothetical protein
MGAGPVFKYLENVGSIVDSDAGVVRTGKCVGFPVSSGLFVGKAVVGSGVIGAMVGSTVSMGI